MRISDWSSDVCSSDLVGMYGEPATSKVMAPSDSIACSFDSLASLRGVSVMIVGTRFDGTTMMWLSGSYAPPPPFGPPPTDGEKIGSEGRRVGKEGGSTCRSRGLPYH